MVEVNLWGSLSAVAGGKARHEIEAKDIRELFRKLAEQYPGIEPWIDRGIAVGAGLQSVVLRPRGPRAPRTHTRARCLLLPTCGSPIRR